MSDWIRDDALLAEGEEMGTGAREMFSTSLEGTNARGLGEKTGAVVIGMRFASREKDVELGAHGSLIASLERLIAAGL